MAIKDLTFRLLGEDKSASSSMTHAQSTAEKVTGSIGGAFSKLGGVIGGEFGEVLNNMGESLRNVGEHSHSATAVMGAAGAGIAGLGGLLMAAGSADKQATDQLDQAIDNSGHSHEQYREEIEKTIKTQENLDHGSADTQQALRKMTTAFKDPKKALEQMGLVANLAAAKHISLADAADRVVKVAGGKGTRTLTEYGITMGKSKDKTHDAQKALEELSKKVDGQAKASMDNFGAKVNEAKTKLGDWVADIGNNFGPAVTVFGGALTGVSAAFEIGKTVMGAFKGVQVAQTAVTVASTDAQLGLNTAMDANPIGLIVLGITALVGGLIWFFTQTKLGQQVWHNVTTFIGNAVKWLWNDVIHPVFTAIGGIFSWLGKNVINPIVSFIKLEIKGWGLIFQWLQKNVIDPVFKWIGTIFHWLYDNVIKPVIGFIKLEIKGFGIIFHWLYDNVIKPVGTWIGNAVTGIGTVFGNVFGAIGGVIKGAFNGVVSFVRGIMNGIIDVVNGVIGGLNTVGSMAKSVGLGGFHLSKIPHLALGGVVTKPTVALIGESGPEAVEPLHQGPGMLTHSGGGEVHVHIHMQDAFVGSERQLAQTINDLLVRTIRGGTLNHRDLRTALGIA